MKNRLKACLVPDSLDIIKLKIYIIISEYKLKWNLISIITNKNFFISIFEMFHTTWVFNVFRYIILNFDTVIRNWFLAKFKFIIRNIKIGCKSSIIAMISEF